jgi:hypothetical protein
LGNQWPNETENNKENVEDAGRGMREKGASSGPSSEDVTYCSLALALARPPRPPILHSRLVCFSAQPPPRFFTTLLSFSPPHIHEGP